jgi:hypothetical protein
MNIPARLKALLLALIAVAVIAPSAAACDSATNDDQTIAPTAFTNPTTGEKCAPWVNNPHETDGSGLRACDFAMPTTQPVRQTGMSDADWFALGAMFRFGLGHSDYYYSDGYYYRHIGPAWSRYPGTYYGYGHAPVTRITTVNNYHTTVVQPTNTKYAAQEKAAAANPKTGGYKTASGKTYTGATAPKSAFKGTNVTPGSAAGDAPTSKPGTTTPKTKNSNTSPGIDKTYTGGSKSYTGSSSGSSSGRSGGSSGSSGRSGGSSGGRR